jgi:ferredoxin
MPRVRFVNENKEIEVPEGAVLRAEAIKAGINLNCGVNGYGESLNKVINCKGLGVCGTCRVLIREGMDNTNKLTRREWIRFKTPVSFPPEPITCMAYVGNEATMRLACRTQVFGDVEVVSSPEVDLFGENFFS